MSEEEAQSYVDLVIEQLHAWGYLSASDYGRMTEDHRRELAEKVAEKSKE